MKLTLIAVLFAALLTDCTSVSERYGVVTMRGTSITLQGDSPLIGDVAPNFKVVDQSFKPIELYDLRGKTVLISAVPSIDTPVCSLQTARFNQELAKFSKDDVVALTISTDLPFAQKRYCAAKGIDAIQILSDAVYDDFGLKYGIRIKDRGILARSVWIIDKYGLIQYRRLVPELTSEPDYDAALKALKTLAENE